MELLPDVALGWRTGLWYTAAFALTNAVLIATSPMGFSRRLFRLPTWVSWRERAVSMVSLFVFARGLMVYTVFVPLSESPMWITVGSVVFLAGLVFHSVAMVNFAATPFDQPVTAGAYRVTRHPMQLVAVLMWFGVSLASSSWVIGLACLAQLFLLCPFLKAQERSCIETYGEPYESYLRNTPRLICRGGSALR
jgi:protein-S-isoprenylcysteine O-methyltransferase Ste14